MPDALTIVLVALSVGLYVLVFIRVFVKNKLAPQKTVSAVVVNKQINESVSKYAGNGKQKKYVVVFSFDGKKKGFYVSEFSYGGYRVGEKGKLTYKGDRLISFK